MPAVSNTGIDQVVCAYNPDNPANNTGFGPVASSLSTLQEVSLFQLAGAILRPPGDAAAGNSIAYERLSSDQDLIVRRVVAIDPLNRENLLSQALVTGRGRFTAELALGLDQDDWPLGDGITQVQLGDRLPRPDAAELDRRGREGADRLRETSRGTALTEALCHLTAWLLTDPLSRLSVAAPQVGGEPRAVLLGLVDMLSPLVPGRWTFSTQESAESEAYRLIVMPNWPRPGSRDYRRLRLGGRPAPDGPAHDAAALLVTRYQEYGLPGLELLRRQQGWHRMSTVERAESLRDLLTLQGGTTPHKALPPPPPETLPTESDGEAFDEYAAAPDEPSAPAEPETDPALDPDLDLDLDRERPAHQEPAAPPPSTEARLPEFAPDEGWDSSAVDAADAEEADREVAGLVEKLFQARTKKEREELLRELASRAGLWSESQIEVACLTAIRYRLGLKYRRVQGASCHAVFPHDPQYLFDLLVRPALYLKGPALEWALFVRHEYTAVLTDPLRSVMRRMLELHERRELVVHRTFFLVLSRWAIPIALRLEPPGTVPPMPSEPPRAAPRRRPATWFKGGRREGKPQPAPRTEAVPQAQPEGNTDDFLLLGKILLLFLAIVLVLLASGQVLHILP